MVVRAVARYCLVDWSRVPKPVTVWFGGDEGRPSVTGWWCFWRSDLPGHSIASGVCGSESCGQQLPGGVGPSGVYMGVYGSRGRGWFGSLVVYAG